MTDGTSNVNFGPDRIRELAQQIEDEGDLTVPTAIEELERTARSSLDAPVEGFLAGAAGRRDTTQSNVTAFDRWRIRPRVLRDVADRRLAVELFGRRLPAPILLAPIGRQELFHVDGERATARAAASLGLPMVLSSAANSTMESVVDEAPDGSHWFQLYVNADDAVNRSFVERAERTGFDALVVTVDNPVRGWRPRELDNSFSQDATSGTANYFADPAFRDALQIDPAQDHETAMEYYREIRYDATVDWERVSSIQATTDLPVLLKGILHPEDATTAVDREVDGVVVSNHGGGHLDGAVAALDALPSVVDAVDGRIPVLFDSGIRTGTDVFKALALGADAVLVGRPYVYGLTIAGENGVRDVLENLIAELDVTLANAGHDDIRDVGTGDVVEVSGNRS